MALFFQAAYKVLGEKCSVFCRHGFEGDSGAESLAKKLDTDHPPSALNHPWVDGQPETESFLGVGISSALHPNSADAQVAGEGYPRLWIVIRLIYQRSEDRDPWIGPFFMVFLSCHVCCFHGGIILTVNGEIPFLVR